MVPSGSENRLVGTGTENDVPTLVVWSATTPFTTGGLLVVVAEHGVVYLRVCSVPLCLARNVSVLPARIACGNV